MLHGEGGGGGVLSVAETVHWIALAFMGVTYFARLLWLFRWKGGRDRQARGERTLPNGAIRGGVYSIGNVAMPWVMESTRDAPLFYVSFVLFHLGVVAGIWLAFFSSLVPAMHMVAGVAYLFMAFMGAAFVVAISRIVRRAVQPHMRLISTPDDWFALFTLSVWFFLGVLAQASFIGLLEGPGYLTAYLFATSFFLIYVPFSKISHYLYYPFTRYWIGKTLGHRGSLPVARVGARIRS